MKSIDQAPSKHNKQIITIIRLLKKQRKREELYKICAFENLCTASGLFFWPYWNGQMDFWACFVLLADHKSQVTWGSVLFKSSPFLWSVAYWFMTTAQMTDLSDKTVLAANIWDWAPKSLKPLNMGTSLTCVITHVQISQGLDHFVIFLVFFSVHGPICICISSQQYFSIVYWWHSVKCRNIAWLCRFPLNAATIK